MIKLGQLGRSTSLLPNQTPSTHRNSGGGSASQSALAPW